MAKVFIKIDNECRIISVGSSVFPLEGLGWIQIDEGHDESYIHAQNGYFPEKYGTGLYNDNGICQFVYEDGAVRERTPEEMAMDIPEPVPMPPSNVELAQILENSYNAMFDGIKYIADPDNPLPLKLPMIVSANLFYIMDGIRYVCVKNGTAKTGEFNDYFERWD